MHESSLQCTPYGQASVETAELVEVVEVVPLCVTGVVEADELGAVLTTAANVFTVDNFTVDDVVGAAAGDGVASTVAVDDVVGAAAVDDVALTSALTSAEDGAALTSASTVAEEGVVSTVAKDDVATTSAGDDVVSTSAEDDTDALPNADWHSSILWHVLAVSSRIIRRLSSRPS
jgi:hypothetical protein